LGRNGKNYVETKKGLKMDLILFVIVILLCLSPIAYLIVEDAHEKENYECYLVNKNGKYYLLVKEKSKIQ
jgi:hypothetical protein